VRWRIACDFYQHWTDLLPGKGLNWRNFTFVKCALEWGGYKGAFLEIGLALLGFGAEIEVYDYVDRFTKMEPIESLRVDYMGNELP